MDCLLLDCSRSRLIGYNQMGMNSGHSIINAATLQQLVVRCGVVVVEAEDEETFFISLQTQPCFIPTTALYPHLHARNEFIALRL